MFKLLILYCAVNVYCSPQTAHYIAEGPPSPIGMYGDYNECVTRGQLYLQHNSIIANPGEQIAILCIPQ